jgi:hypothetical protein
VPQVWVPLGEQSPDTLALQGIGDLGGIGAGINRRHIANVMRLLADRNRHSWISLDIRELLTSPEYQEVDREPFIGESDNGGLRPTIGAYGRNRHGPVRCENPNGIINTNGIIEHDNLH